MNRLGATLKLDIRVQYRNRLYAVGVAVSVFLAVLLWILADPDQLPQVVPALMLLALGGTTLFYVAGLLLFERDEGTLHAVVVSPLRTAEYLWSKVLTLAALSTLEALLMLAGAMWLMGRVGLSDWPNVPVFLLGVVALNIMYTLIGLILVVRYHKVTDFLMPAAALVGVLQMPFLHFLGLVEHPAFLAFPPSAPTLIIQGAYLPLTAGEWAYALGYTALVLAGLSVWAIRAFHRHVRMNLG